MTVSVGMRDEGGNLLILGGHKANLWILQNGLYAVAGERVINSESAVELYNQYNGTNLDRNYILNIFYPWYEKQFSIIASVPSRTNPTKSYTVRKSPSGELTCECQGFWYRRECWHIEAVKELTNDEENFQVNRRA